MIESRQKLVRYATEFVDVRAALQETLEEKPSTDRDLRIERLTERKDQLMRAVMAMEIPSTERAKGAA